MPFSITIKLSICHCNNGKIFLAGWFLFNEIEVLLKQVEHLIPKFIRDKFDTEIFWHVIVVLCSWEMPLFLLLQGTQLQSGQYSDGVYILHKSYFEF